MFLYRMRLLVLLLGCFHVIVNARNLKMALHYHSHPSLINYDMKDYCNQNINVAEVGRNSGGILSVKISQEDIASNFSCTVALAAPRKYRVLVALKKLEISRPGSSCTDYIMVINGGLNNTDYLSNKICGYYDENHSRRLVFYSTTISSTLSVRVHKQANEDNNYDFGLALTFTAFSRSQRGTCSGKDQMLCDNKICIWEHFKCNGHNNCGDGSDEKYCGNDFPASESPDSPKLRFPTTLASVLFVGVLLIIIVAGMLILCHKRYPACWSKLFPVEPGSRHLRARRGATTAAILSDSNRRSTTSGCDNDGFVPDQPPLYEEVVLARNHQSQNEDITDPPDYPTACKSLRDQTDSGVSSVRGSEFPIWHQVMSVKL